MRELFVYYRVRPDDAAALGAAVAAMQARLQSKHPGLLARLLRQREHRPEDADSLGGLPTAEASSTWMETYAVNARGSPAGVTAAIESAIEAEAAPLLSMIDGPRHTEVFVA